MDEKRKFFRIKNKGEISAQFGTHSIHVIDISASSMAIVPDIDLPQSGTIELRINLFLIQVEYDILRSTKESIILLFPKEEHINKLLPVLKNQRKFVRIKNQGEISAEFNAHPIHIIDICACSAAISCDIDLPQTGVIRLKVNFFVLDVLYETLKSADHSTVLIFKNEEQINKLVPVIKNLSHE